MSGDPQYMNLYITHVHPETTWLKVWGQLDVKLSEQIENTLAGLENEFEGGIGTPHPIDIRPGDICCAKFSEDGKWYRARVVDLSVLSLGKIGVKFLDYGNTEIVSVTEVRKMDHHPICSVPPQATEFILSDVKPVGNCWDDKALAYTQETICYQEARGVIVGHEGSVPKICLFVPTVTPDNFARHLVDKQLAKLVTVELYTNQELQQGKTYSVYVSHAISIKEFWVQLCDSEDKLEELASGLEAYGLSPNKVKLPQPAVWEPCVTQYSEDGLFCRGQVTSIDGKTCKVQYVDYGNSDSKMLCDLLAIPSQMLTLAMQAVRCSLKGCEKVPETENISSAFSSLTGSKKLSCTVVSGLNPTSGYTVELCNDKNQNLIDLLLGNPPRGSSLTQSVGYIRIPLTVGNAHEVKMSHVENLETFYCQVMNTMESLEMLTKQLEMEMDGSCSRVTELEFVPGFPCCIQDDSGKWYRVEVIQNIETGLVEIQYVDYGVFEVVSAKRLMRLPLACARDPPVLATECALKDCRDNRPDLGEHLERLTSGKMMIAQVIEDWDSTAVVDLYDVESSPHVYINGAIQKISTGKTPFVPVVQLNPIESVYIVNVESSGKVFGQLARLPPEELDVFQESLNSHYDALPRGTGKLYANGSTHAGEFCCARFSDDNLIYRGKILREVPPNLAEVFFVDYGNIEVKPIEEIFALDPKFTVLVQQGIVFRFVGVKGEKVYGLKDELIESTVEVKVVQTSSLISRGHCVLLTNIPENEAVREKLFGPQVTKVAPRGKDTGAAKFRMPVLNEEEEVIVTAYLKPDFFACQLQRSAFALRHLFSETADYCCSVDPESSAVSTPIPGQPCLAEYNSGCWYRAHVVKVIASDKVEVTYVDFGNNEEVALSSIQTVPNSFFNMPRQSVFCKLIGISADDTWTEAQSNILEKMILEKCFMATFDVASIGAGVEPFSVTLIDTDGVSVYESFTSRARPAVLPSTPVPSSPPPSVNSWDQSRCNEPNHNGRSFGTGRVRNDSYNNSSNNNKKTYRENSWRDDERKGTITSSRFEKKQSLQMNGGDGFDGCNADDFDNGFQKNSWRADKDGGGFQKKGGGGRARGDSENSNWRSNTTRQEKTFDGWNKRSDSTPTTPTTPQWVPQAPKTDLWDSNELSTNGTKPSMEPQLKQKSLFSLPNSETPSFEAPLSAYTMTILKPGERKNVGVVHVVTPTDFYVHLTEQDVKLQKLTDSLAEAYDPGEQPQLKDIAVGRTCCAKFTEDDAWYRAKVMSVNGNDIEVLFVDYGNRDVVAGDSVRQLKKDFAEQPTFAVRCSLHNIKSVNGSGWSQEEVDHFTNMTLDLSLEFQVVSCGTVDAGSVVAVGNLLEGSVRTSIAQRMVNDGRAVIEKMDVSSELPALPVAADATYEVALTWFVSPTNFYVQKRGRQGNNVSTSLDVLMKEMQEFYSFPENLALSVRNWSEETPCVARFTEDDVWYRAKISAPRSPTGKTESDKVDVSYVDFGNREVIQRDRVCGLAPKFAVLPAQAIHCRLQSVRPVGQQWVLIPQENVDRYFAPRGTMVTFHGCHKGLYLVDVVTNNGRGLAQELMNDGFATMASSTPSMTSTTSSGEVTVKSDVTNPFPSLKMDWIKGEYKDVVVCSLGQSNRFWCQLIRSEGPSLAQQLDGRYEKLGPLEQKLANPNRGTPCVVRSARDGHWYRAVVQNRLSSIKLSVLCVDTGMDEIVPITQAKVISAEFLKIPVESFPCSLHGVSETGIDPDEFVRATYLKELVAQLEVIIGDSYVVTLFDVADSQEKNLNEILIAIASDEVPPFSELVAPFSPPNLDWTIGEDKVVIVSGMEKPDSFWCQLASSEENLEILCQKLEEHYSSLPVNCLKLTKFTPSTPCVMKSSINNKWYRASIIQQLSLVEVKVFLIDLGLLDDVHISEIKDIAPEFLQPPREAFHCSLSGLANENVTDAVVCHFFSLVGEQLTAKLEGVSENGAYEVSLFDSSMENPESILSRLTGKEEIDSGVRFPPPEVSWEIGELKDVTVSGPGLPDQFWCQLLSDKVKMEELSVQMAAYYEDLTVDKLSVLVPVIGKAVAVQSRTSKKWFRAVVSTISKSTKIMATLVDTGEWEKFSLSQVKAMAPEFVTSPVMALECELIGLPENAEVRKMGYDFFNLIVDKQLKARLDVRRSGSFGVTLFDSSSGREVNVNEHLVAIYQGRIETAPSVKLTPSLHFQPPVVPSGIHEAYVCHVNTPKQFYIQLSAIEADLSQLSEDLNGAYLSEMADNNNHVLPAGTLPGHPCCAIYGEDETWNRGELMSIAGNSMTIKFVDYGNTESISSDKVKTLLPEFIITSPLAIECRLSNIADDQHEWTTEEIENFQNMVMDKPLHVEFLTVEEPCDVLIRLERDSLPVELAQTPKKEPEDVNVVLGSVEKISVAEDETQRIVIADLQSVEEINVAEDDEPEVVLAESQVKKIPTDFIYRQFPCGKRLTGGTSHIVSPGRFWLQLDDDASVLSDAAEQLEQKYVVEAEAVAESESTEWVAMGSACATRYSEDGGWYRSKILAVELDDVHVQFVDYGNSDTVHTSSVRRLTRKLMEMPVMAIHCELAGVEQREDEWTVDAIEDFETLVEDKSLLVEFVGRAVDDERYMVRLLDMGRDVATEMSKRGFATLKDDYRTGMELAIDVEEEEGSKAEAEELAISGIESNSVCDRTNGDEFEGLNASEEVMTEGVIEETSLSNAGSESERFSENSGLTVSKDEGIAVESNGTTLPKMDVEDNGLVGKSESILIEGEGESAGLSETNGIELPEDGTALSKEEVDSAGLGESHGIELPEVAEDERSLPEVAEDERSFPEVAEDERSFPEVAEDERSLPEEEVDSAGLGESHGIELPEIAEDERSLPEEEVDSVGLGESHGIELPEVAEDERSLPEEEEDSAGLIEDHGLELPDARNDENSLPKEEVEVIGLVADGEMTLAKREAESVGLTKDIESELPTAEAETDGMLISKTDVEIMSELMNPEVLIAESTCSPPRNIETLILDGDLVSSRHSTPRPKPGTSSKVDELNLSLVDEEVGSSDDMILDTSIHSGGFDTNSIQLDEEEGVEYCKDDEEIRVLAMNVGLDEEVSCTRKGISDLPVEVNTISASDEPGSSGLSVFSQRIGSGSTEGYQASVSQNLENSTSQLFLQDLSARQGDVSSKGLDVSCTTVSSSFEWEGRSTRVSVGTSPFEIGESVGEGSSKTTDEIDSIHWEEADSSMMVQEVDSSMMVPEVDSSMVVQVSPDLKVMDEVETESEVKLGSSAEAEVESKAKTDDSDDAGGPASLST